MVNFIESEPIMEKITFELNSINIPFGTRQVSVKHSYEILSDADKKRFSFHQDWINVECMYHSYDHRIYIDLQTAENWSLARSTDENGVPKQVDIVTPGMTKGDIMDIYLIKIFNPQTMVFEERECYPFVYLNHFLKVTLLIPEVV